GLDLDLDRIDQWPQGIIEIQKERLAPFACAQKLFGQLAFRDVPDQSIENELPGSRIEPHGAPFLQPDDSAIARTNGPKLAPPVTEASARVRNSRAMLCQVLRMKKLVVACVRLEALTRQQSPQLEHRVGASQPSRMFLVPPAANARGFQR